MGQGVLTEDMMHTMGGGGQLFQVVQRDNDTRELQHLPRTTNMSEKQKMDTEITDNKAERQAKKSRKALEVWTLSFLT